MHRVITRQPANVSYSRWSQLHIYIYPPHIAQYPSTFRVACSQAVSFDLSRGLTSSMCCVFIFVRFIFVQYARIVFQCNPDVKFSSAFVCWINPALVLSSVNINDNMVKIWPFYPNVVTSRHVIKWSLPGMLQNCHCQACYNMVV